ncbi:MAG TPA: hypothetical protein VIM84_11090 [Gemmatimonadales bacterium]
MEYRVELTDGDGGKTVLATAAQEWSLEHDADRAGVVLSLEWRLSGLINRDLASIQNAMPRLSVVRLFRSLEEGRSVFVGSVVRVWGNELSAGLEAVQAERRS